MPFITDTKEDKNEPPTYEGSVLPVLPAKKSFLSSLKDHLPGLESPEHRHAYILRCIEEENQRWPTPQLRDIAKRYQTNVGIGHLAANHDKRYLDKLQAGYFEPIPIQWSLNPLSLNPLTLPVPGTAYADGAEQRLYWVMNHSYFHGKKREFRMSPNEEAELAMARRRMWRAKSIDTSFASDGDYFKANAKYLNKGYSKQVPAAPLHKDVIEMQHKVHEGQIHVDTMILLDVSGSMGWDHQGFDQPRHVDVVHNILKRAIFHMSVRDHYPDPQGHHGVDTVMFNTYGHRIGKLSSENFEQQWGRIRKTVYEGGGTQVMSGWNLVKQTHFELHGKEGKAWYDKTYGWQAGPEMPKLSLLLMLDGEANDMDEFELDLLGENWAYVTILLIGKEDCPDHHRHANELDRISRANDHIQFYDCHGRICERLLVHDVLQRVYAENAPTTQDIMNPNYDLPPPPYSMN